MGPDSGVRVPDVDAELLLAQLEYARWATQKTLGMVDRLPPDAMTRPVTNSFPTLLATLQHVFGWDKYYFIHLQGGHAERQSIAAPDTYQELKTAWTALHCEMIRWAKRNLAARKDLVLDGWGVWPTWMVVLQMTNHGTHHLGQVVTLVRQLGGESPRMQSTDMIRYLLRRYPQDNQKERVRAFLEADPTPLEAPDPD